MNFSRETSDASGTTIPSFSRSRWSVCILLLACSASLTPGLAAQGAGVHGFDNALSQGLLHARAGELHAAEADFLRATSIRPQDARALTALGQVEEQLGEYAKSVQTFQAVLRLDEQSPEAHINLAIAMADEGKLSDAMEEAQTALQLNPGLAAAHLLRGRLLNDLGQRQEAKDEFRKALRISPRDLRTLRSFAALEEEEGDVDAEADLLKRYLAQQPRDPQASFRYGQLMHEKRQEQEAIRAWRQAIALNPEYREATYNLARALKSTSPKEAQALFARVATLEQSQQVEDQVRTLGNAGNESMAHGEYAGAIQKYQQAMMLCGTCADLGALQKNLGLAYCHKGELNTCLRLLQKAKESIADDPDVNVAMQMAQAQQAAAVQH